VARKENQKKINALVVVPKGEVPAAHGDVMSSVFGR
jgi:hypothetical protein